MVLFFLRGLFVLLMAAVAYYFLIQTPPIFGHYTWLILLITVAAGVLLVCIDILSPRKKLALFSGTFLGLIVGMLVSYAFSFIVQFVVDQYLPVPDQTKDIEEYKMLVIHYTDLVMGVAISYLAISFILQTKDDFRFIIPYVEFSKQTRGARPILLDTSVLIDGRISDIAETGIVDSQLVLPRFVLNELQAVADSGDRLMRAKGRRGLEVMQKLQSNKKVDVVMYDAAGRGEETEDVDLRLLALASDLNWRIFTTDFNLYKVAGLRGVDVININDLANSVKPVVLPGELLTVRLIKAGEAPGQGVGYLEDGTMVVVEHGKPHLQEEVQVTVTNMRQTSAGKMIFARLDGSPAPAARSQAT